MATGGFYHCLISSPFNSENICSISPTKSDVLGRVMEGLLRGYFSKGIRLIRLENPSDSLVVHTRTSLCSKLQSPCRIQAGYIEGFDSCLFL